MGVAVSYERGAPEATATRLPLDPHGQTTADVIADVTAPISSKKGTQLRTESCLKCDYHGNVSRWILTVRGQQMS
jgi:hypothetical protein